jgi:hypothetical protein
MILALLAALYLKHKREGVSAAASVKTLTVQDCFVISKCQQQLGLLCCCCAVVVQYLCMNYEAHQCYREL